MSEDELEIAILNCFNYAPQTTEVDRLGILQEAEFYTRELARRQDDKNATRDLVLEIIIIVLIALELALGLYQIREQAIYAAQEQEAFFNLQGQMASTTGILSNLAATTAKMNTGVQKELDLYYEPSLVITYVFKRNDDFLEIHNYGRTGITVFGVKTRERVCSLETPMRIASGVDNDLDWHFVIDRVVSPVISSGGSAPLTIYFKAENGKEYQHQVLVDRFPVVAGHGVTIINQNTEPSTWGRELAQRSAGKCPR